MPGHSRRSDARRRAPPTSSEPLPGRPRTRRESRAHVADELAGVRDHAEGLPRVQDRGNGREPLGAARVVAGRDGPGRAGQGEERVDARVGRRPRVAERPVAVT